MSGALTDDGAARAAIVWRVAVMVGEDGFEVVHLVPILASADDAHLTLAFTGDKCNRCVFCVQGCCSRRRNREPGKSDMVTHGCDACQALLIDPPLNELDRG